MSVRRLIPEYDGLYFITFTCIRWIRLFEIADAYDLVYKWFDYLKGKGHYVVGYVIMPNHVHALLAFSHTQGKSINTIIGNGKRFMAYELVKRLEAKNARIVLQHLSGFVKKADRQKGKLHVVFEPSFDWKECYSDKFIEQKLNYIHANPCKAPWDLAKYPWEYEHSSARCYYGYKGDRYSVTHYAELKEVDLTKPKIIE